MVATIVKKKTTPDEGTVLRKFALGSFPHFPPVYYLLSVHSSLSSTFLKHSRILSRIIPRLKSLEEIVMIF